MASRTLDEIEKTKDSQQKLYRILQVEKVEPYSYTGRPSYSCPYSDTRYNDHVKIN